MQILVTAFGPFDNRSENASSLVLRQLKLVHPKIRTRILPVDSIIAPARLQQALRLIQPDALLLLGEAAGSKSIHLEMTAFNEIDFRIPDVAGRQPTPRPIHSGAPPIRRSTLPFEAIHTQLRAKGYEISLSNDPGRYLCNQVLYVALGWIERHSIPCRAGFVHLPLAHHYATEQATDAVSQILRSL